MTKRHAIAVLIILTLLAPLARSVGARNVVCDSRVWLCGVEGSATIGGGSTLPGMVPAIDDSGLAWMGPGAELTDLLHARPGGEDALAISYALAGVTKTLVNTKMSVQLSADLVTAGGNYLHFSGANDEVQLDVEYLLPDFDPDAGVVLITMRLTNVSTAPLADVRLSRSLNPNIQVGASVPDDFQAMTRPQSDAVIAALAPIVSAGEGGAPLGAALLMGSLDVGGVSSVEGDLIVDPFDVLASPRDPSGAVEDTSLAVARDFGLLSPGETATFRIALVTASTPDHALAVFRAVPEPTTWTLALTAAALGLSCRARRASIRC